MADFVAAFIIDDSTILSRLHLAAVQTVKKTNIGRFSGDSIFVQNSGFTSEKDLSKNFKTKDSKYYLVIGVRTNLKNFDGTLDFMASSGYGNIDDLKKKAKNHILDSRNTSFLSDLKKQIFKAMRDQYLRVFAGDEKVEDLDEDKLKLVASEFPFKNGEVKDKTGIIGFRVDFTVGLE